MFLTFLFDSTFHSHPIYIASVHQSSWIEGMQVQFWTFDPLESQNCCGCLFSTRDVWSASSKVLLQEINAWEESWKLRQATKKTQYACIYDIIYKIYCINILGKVALALSVTAVHCNILQLNIWCVQPFTTCPFLRLEYKWWQGPRRLEDQSWVKQLYK